LNHPIVLGWLAFLDLREFPVFEACFRVHSCRKNIRRLRRLRIIFE
jgi:hypothetical protein